MPLSKDIRTILEAAIIMAPLWFISVILGPVYDDILG